MKKTIICILTIILTLSSCINISAQETSNFIYNYGNITVIFDSDTTLSTEQQQHIANRLANGDDNTSTYNLWCNLWGHNYDTTEGATAITHEVSPTEPRCYKEYFIVYICSRCEESGQIESLGGEYIVCCPE